MKNYLLCYHDFSVHNVQKSLKIIQFIYQRIKRPFSILVVPDTSRATPEELRDFKNALQELKALGFEFALHGYSHSGASEERSLLGKLIQKITASEAEFAGLSKRDTEILVHKGLTSFQNLISESPSAFIPPTWYANSYLKKQLPSSSVYETRFFLTREKKIFSPVASFAGLPPVLEKLAFYFGKWMFKIPFGVKRIALHPTDKIIFNFQIFKILEEADKTHQLIFYKALNI